MSEQSARSRSVTKRLRMLFGGIFAISIIQSFIWLALFSTPILQGAVFFYRGIILLAFSVIFTLLTIFSIRKLIASNLKSSFDRIFSLETCFSAIIFCSSLCLSFFVVVPVTIERSVTTFMLGRMENSSPMTKEQLRNLLSVDYMNETNAVERRTSEQVISGNLKANLNGEFEITTRAKLFLRFSEFVADLFAVQPSYRTDSIKKK